MPTPPEPPLQPPEILARGPWPIEQVQASWLAKLNVVDPLSGALRKLCRAGVKATPAEHARLHSLLG